MNAIVARPSHVALLVPSVRRTADFLKRFDFQIGPEGEFEGEGTREIYIEGDKSNSLLLMEPIGPGPYQRALDKRGPGVHHLAVDVDNVEGFLHHISGSGWLLHPSSVQTLKRNQTAYLARPGFPALIEVHQQVAGAERERFISAMAMHLQGDWYRLVDAVGLGQIIQAGTYASITMGKSIVPLKDLVK